MDEVLRELLESKAAADQASELVRAAIVLADAARSRYNSACAAYLKDKQPGEAYEVGKRQAVLILAPKTPAVAAAERLEWIEIRRS